MMDPTINPNQIMQLGMGFMASKTLLSAVELEIFTVLGRGSMTGPQLADRLALHPRSMYDFLDALVALGILAREGDGPDGHYTNTAESGMFLDKTSPAYVGGILEMANARLYRHWGNLTIGLKTGEPQNETKEGGGGFFEVLYKDEQLLEQFLRAMQGVQVGSFMALVEKVDLSGYTSFVDVGGANGALSTVVARKFPNLRCRSFDLPVVVPIAKRHVAAMGLADRIEVVPGNFFEGDLPKADVLTMGNVLHDWDEAQKKLLIAKAHAAINPGGRFIAIENESTMRGGKTYSGF